MPPSRSAGGITPTGAEQLPPLHLDPGVHWVSKMHGAGWQRSRMQTSFAGQSDEVLH